MRSSNLRVRPALGALLACCVLLFACNSGRDRHIADLQSPRAEERAEAVKSLAEASRPEDLVLFTRAAKDASALVRSEAAVALGRSQDPRVVDLLGELLGDSDEDVQKQAAHALAAIKSEKATAYLTLQYARRGRSTRQAIVEALKAANVPGAMASVVAAEANALWSRNLSALNQGTLSERVAAAEELGKSGRAEAVSRLSTLLKDSQVVLAAAAVRGLGHAGDRRVVPALAGLLQDKFPELREAATESLLRLGDPLALPRLREAAIENSATSPLATSAILSLPRSPESDAALCELALRASFEEAVTAGREMRRRGGCPLGPIEAELGSRREPWGGLQAVIGLGSTAKPVVAKVIPWLDHSDERIQRLAVEALAEAGDTSAAAAIQKVHDRERASLGARRADWISKPLPKAFGAPFGGAGNGATAGSHEAEGGDRAKHADLFRRVQELNAQRLKAAGRVAATPREPTELVDDVPDEDLALLASTVEALGKLKAPGAQTLLQSYADDGNVSLRTAAWAGLASQGGAGISAAKAGLLEQNRQVQERVALALAEEGPEGQKALLQVIGTKVGDRLPLLSGLTQVQPIPEASAVLQQLVREGGADAAVAAQLLGQMGAKDATQTLIDALKDPSTIARRDLLNALGALKDPSAAEVIVRDLFHDSADVRAAAAEALAQLKGNVGTEALDALKGDYYRRVRESAERALTQQAPHGSAQAQGQGG